jgi:phosphoglycolate phosphatase-like HAD superfamily hydrolase
MGKGSAPIYLDLDGTLVDVQEKYCRLHMDIAKGLGFQPTPPDRFWAQKRRGAPLETILSDWDEPARRAYNRLWLTSIEAPDYLRIDKLVPGTREALEALTQSFRLVVVTMRRNGSELRRQLRELEIDDYLTAVIAAADYPSADYTKVQLLRLSGETNGQRAIVVGDSEADVQTAREIGAPAVCVLSGIRDGPFLKALDPDYVIPSVSQLPKLVTDSVWAERMAS